MVDHNESFLESYLPTAVLDCAVNVGAHEGLWIEKMVPKFRRVLAIEASPASAAVLRKRWPEPPVTNVEVFEAAGWITGGQMMEFNVRAGAQMSSALACRDIQRDSGVSEVIRVPTLAIDDLNLPACDLVWVDVEGAEMQVLMGATRTIERCHPELIIECHEAEHREWIQTWLFRAGYNIALIHEPQREMHEEWGRHVYLVAQYYRYAGRW